MYLVSACLAGINCRYDGGNNFNKNVADLVKSGKAVPVCPEVLGGLDTPRVPSEIAADQHGNKKVITENGQDITAEFKLGAEKTIKIARIVEAKKTILKQRSPSCGCGKIYDGTFSGNLIKGNGFTAELLIENGIEVLTEDDLERDSL
ncbi:MULTISPECIES: DUF523 domain-containing protein [unclassified Halanaerobium]|uniref:DUF523 domain-containing protein n=1 Tax=unclassified Halanaerobium TaxID=2641197 RepID=UPI000DF10EEC|nr:MULTISPECIES: DUF523 domain-containing protein [unclassified Halanaerobium]RCW40548.1 uncharacterized protein YbbK (DUF523 family) [Halanaerobium sp. MA284_MarDTE_T2]RCW78891.1 uncharacterized protein YbbK (DUF523 family) [Halanaerobium sp. DL-01]